MQQQHFHVIILDAFCSIFLAVINFYWSLSGAWAGPKHRRLFTHCLSARTQNTHERPTEKGSKSIVKQSLALEHKKASPDNKIRESCIIFLLHHHRLMFSRSASVNRSDVSSAGFESREVHIAMIYLWAFSRLSLSPSDWITFHNF